jgi:hypothetical protein
MESIPSSPIGQWNIQFTETVRPFRSLRRITTGQQTKKRKIRRLQTDIAN